jgi:hypothetical protein
MKKNTYLLVFCLTASLLIFTSIASFGQSLLITPENTIAENTFGDNINIRSNSHFIGLQSLRYNGTSASKSPVINGDYLLRIGAGGYYSPTLTDYSLDRASIYFKADQDWSSTAKGTRISFLTTANNDVNSLERMVITNDGNIGIGTATPTGTLHIYKPSSDGNPAILLQSTAPSEFSSGFSSIEVSSTNKSGKWTNEFGTDDDPAQNYVRWFFHKPSNNSIPLILHGSGDARIGRNLSIEEYTNLGYDAPKIKMKELSTTTSGASGGEIGEAHGLTQAKILSVSVLVNGAAGNDIPPNTSASFYPGYEYTFYVSSTSIFIRNSAGNHTSIANRPARILITYKE